MRPSPTFVRLAWHSSGTYSAHDKTGGSNGSTMRLKPESSWGANAGLQGARDILEPLQKKHGISFADIYTLSGVVAIEKMGGPVIPWRAGRIDSAVPTSVPDGRLPSADKGTSDKNRGHIREIFYRMGFNDREIVALSGAHALGRCHTDASGYWGPWTRAETTFSNEYFRLLLEEKWTLKKTHEGKAWTGPAQYETKDGQLMMLPTDLALVEDGDFKKFVQLYAKDEDLYFKDFAAAYSKLLELGVPFPNE
jgi:cytochrome c peroxidase